MTIGPIATEPVCAAKQSGGPVFFEDKQLLLPADYLSPQLSSVNNAISTLNLARGLKALQVPRNFLGLHKGRCDQAQ